MNFKTFKKGVVLGVAILAICGLSVPAAFAQLNPRKIPQFVTPLPLLGAPIEVVTVTNPSIVMREFTVDVLPSGMALPGGVVYNGTKVWGYRDQAGATPTPSDTYIGPVFVATRGTPTQVKWVNNLPTARPNVPNFFWWTATDQTLHWADPGGLDCAMFPAQPECALNYSGPVPAVVHLHGGEVPPQLDGGPDAWYLSTPAASAAFTQKGHSYHTKPGVGVNDNEAVYNYPNTQEAASIWFHDHALGITRLNVYAGLAGAYIIKDDGTNPPNPAQLNDPTKIVPIVIQDRMFDANGQLFFPSIGINPEHPFWVPEFVGDVIVVNGKTWPFLDVGQNSYRFLFLNGSNARAYQMSFKAQGKGAGKVVLPTFWVIGNDGGYLNNPVPLQQLTIMPGERYDVIVDFSGVPVGTSLLLTNSARTPFPGGGNVQSSTTGRIMQFNVLMTPPVPAAPTIGYVPVATDNLRTSNIESLAAVTPLVKRQLTLNEVIGAGGPLEVLVNNTKWGGSIDGTTARTDFTAVTNGDGSITYYSELPKEGQTEQWEIINITADAHPIHLHLVQFQLVNRQAFNVKGYIAAYDAAFPGGGVYIPAFGPPNNYNVLNADGAVGGNPALSAPVNFLLGAPVPAGAYEAGWKDTVIMYPGEVTRIKVRWAPTDASAATVNYFPFDPNGGHGYVWHCHIIDHEDNEMMRPTQVDPLGSLTNPGTPVRSFTPGSGANQY
jgi:FtsP/CotA-like multicopper oxidase with cupredoxin domain